jgi:hypothetical protein
MRVSDWAKKLRRKVEVLCLGHSRDHSVDCRPVGRSAGGERKVGVVQRVEFLGQFGEQLGRLQHFFQEGFRSVTHREWR